MHNQTKHRTRWTREEMAYLQTHYGFKSAHKIAEELGRTRSAVISRCRYLPTPVDEKDEDAGAPVDKDAMVTRAILRLTCETFTASDVNVAFESVELMRVAISTPYVIRRLCTAGMLERVEGVAGDKKTHFYRVADRQRLENTLKTV